MKMNEEQLYWWEEAKFFCEDTSEECVGYKNYLKTKHWKEMRISIYRKYNRHCSQCGKALQLRDCHVHHKTYDRVGHENDNDLLLLCHDCHKTIHGVPIRQQKTWKEKTWKKKRR